jgi:hypothetical protein
VKKIVLFLLLPVWLISCGGIKVVKDDFKNATVVSMKERYSSDESMIKGGGWAVFTYVREIKKNILDPTVIQVHITKAHMPFFGNLDLQPKGIVKVDDMTSEVALGDRAALNVTTYTATPDYATRGAQISSSKHEEWTTKLALTKKIEDAIAAGKKLSFRLYFGEQPITFILSDKEFAKVKEFLATREKQ